MFVRNWQKVFRNEPLDYEKAIDEINRSLLRKQLSNQVFDILVIGGGATGAGIALDASGRGLKVALVQSSDFSSGTSSKYPTCLLLQGGIGFREGVANMSKFTLAPDAKIEREKYLKLGSYLVDNFTIFSPLFSARQWLKYFINFFISSFTGIHVKPVFNYHLGRGQSYFGVSYNDNMQRDARLNTILITTAISQGAVCCNYIRVNKLIEENGRVTGAEVRDNLEHEDFTIKAKCVINATGSGCEFVRNLLPTCLDSSTSLKVISQPKVGMHLILNRPTLPENSGLVYPFQDGSVVFFIHYEGFTLAGIEDSPFCLEAAPTLFQVDQVLRVLNSFLNEPISLQNVQSVWTGWRPLLAEFESARDFIIEPSHPGLISVTGGAWSEFRKMAECTVDYVIKDSHLVCTANQRTDRNKGEVIRLIGCKKMQSFYQYQQGVNIPDKILTKRWYKYYGDRALFIQELYNKNEMLKEKLHPSFNYLMAEVYYCIRYELAVTIGDILLRRLPIGYLNPELALSLIPKLSSIFVEEKGWSEEKAEQERKRAKTELSLLLLPK